jgi:hypothetical protein
MKILFTCQFFNYCSGSAMYVHNVSKELVKRGHEVTIVSELGGDIANSALKNGVRLIDFSQIFDIQDETFDVMHLNQMYPAQMATEYFPDIPAVFTIHSELSSVETPYQHPSIKQYISVRDSITNKYKQLNPVQVPIPVDMERFNMKNVEEVIEVKRKASELGPVKKIVLYVGTVDFLREQVLKDLAQRALDEDFELWTVGRNFLPYNQPAHVKMLPETFFVEKYYEMADEIAGILLGTSQLEASACGKPYRHYEVDEKGKILSYELMQPMIGMKGSEYDLESVVTKFEEIYKTLL